VVGGEHDDQVARDVRVVAAQGRAAVYNARASRRSPPVGLRKSMMSWGGSAFRARTVVVPLLKRSSFIVDQGLRRGSSAKQYANSAWDEMQARALLLSGRCVGV
jgi:hypothetical protein